LNTNSGTTADSRIPFDVTIEVGGKPFRFPLLCRPLRLGPAATVDYYWMDLRAARNGDPVLVDLIVHYWWTAMQMIRVHQDADQVKCLLLASCFPVVARRRCQQQVFVDAHLWPDRSDADGEPALDDDTRARLRRVAASRDRAAVREELFRLLGPSSPDPALDLEVGYVLDGVLTHGVDLIRGKGTNGLREFIDVADQWLAKTLKRGGSPLGRAVAHTFCYVSKCSFFLGYTNTWIGLVPWLKAHRNLDPVSERFMRLWHYQNQPFELSNGALISDAFCGQVLAQHPLSAFFMSDPALCATAGALCSRPDYDQLLRDGTVAGCSDYWNLVDAILTAAAMYRQARAAQPPDRGRRGRKVPTRPMDPAEVPTSKSTATVVDLFCSATVKWPCPACGGPLIPANDGVGTHGDDGRVELRFTCQGCATSQVRRVSREGLAEALGVD
jgi:hypothetical protein